MSSIRFEASSGAWVRHFVRRAAATVVSVPLLATAISAYAEEAKEKPVAAMEEVFVTGTRLKRDGMSTPTPVTMVNAEELESMAPGMLIEGLSQLPQFFGNQGLNTGGSWFTNAGYGNLNLRGLGVNRTLTLLNGRRMISSTAFGGVDINTFPEAMIRSVETVTGGASAAYGSDAVAGVVSFMLDTDFTGFEVKAQMGETAEDDGDNNEISIAFGMDIGERGHIQASWERAEQDRIDNLNDRSWYKGYGTVRDANGILQVAPNVVPKSASFNGILFAPGTALQGMEFTADGQGIVPFVQSGLTTGLTGTPPANQSVISGGSGDDFNSQVTGYGVMPDHERESLFVYGDYEITDDFKVFAQYIKGSNDTWQYNNTGGSYQGTPTSITIFQDNAFLPESVRQTMVDNGIPSFVLRKMGSLSDTQALSYLDTESESEAITVGFEYDVTSGPLEGWSIDGYYQTGENERHGLQHGLRVDRIFAAVDAVVDPATGNTVCRTSLFGNAFPGCTPVNLFGQGNASAAALDYITGFEAGQSITTPIYFADTGFDSGQQFSYTTDVGKVNNIYMDQDLFELSAAGPLFEGWAGPIDLAVGFSYREEEILQLVEDVTNPASDHSGAFHPVSCSDAAIGLQGVSVPDCLNTVGVQYSKVSNIQGSVDVKEYFLETNIPLVADAAAMQSMSLNLATRLADYSTSGDIWAWKAGLDMQFTDEIRLRGTLSRDVRAPNLSELYDKTGGATTITDPRTGLTGNTTFFTGGNPLLDPEEADTITIGLVYQPAFADGLSISVDWYEVEIDGAIGTLTPQGVVNACEAGDQAACANIQRNPVDDTLVLVGDPFINIDREIASGIDVEIGYVRDVEIFGDAAESLGLRFFMSYLDERSETNGGAAKIDRAGQTGIESSTGTHYALPEYKWTAQFTYNYGDFTTFLQGRYIGEGVNENNPSSTFTLSDNDVDSVFYTDLNFSYGKEMNNGLGLEAFFNITNLMDEEPPVTPYYSIFFSSPDQSNELLFDLLGRRFTAGIRLRY